MALQYKLGKKAAIRPAGTLMMAKYLAPNLPSPPPSVDHISQIGSLGMLANDRLGDCTCAGAGHLIQLWTQYDSGNEAKISDQDIVDAYAKITGYNPVTGNNDEGAVEAEVLSYWRNNGIAGHKIDAYVSVDHSNIDHVKQSIHLFGGCYIGVALPMSIEDQGDEWTVARNITANQYEGGHCVVIGAYDESWLSIITWGKIVKISYEWFHRYCDEAWTILSPDWTAKNQKDPDGFDFQNLQEDLKLV